MSTMIMSACWPLDGMSITQKAVLISLADNANDQGVCWPSIPTIARRVCGSERAVQNAIQWLEAARIVIANRVSGRHTSYTLTPAAYAPPRAVLPGGKCAGAPALPRCDVRPSPASAAGEPRTPCIPPPQQVPSNRQEPSREPSSNRHAAARGALHAELRSMALPDWLDRPAWEGWCEHREAKDMEKAAPWTRAAAGVALKRLATLREQGHDPAACLDEAILRGWTGLFPMRGDAATPAAPANVAPNWWKTAQGIRGMAAHLAVAERPGQVFEQFKARVFKAAGPGEWMESMLGTVARESAERYDALHAFFNDPPRSPIAQTEAA